MNHAKFSELAQVGDRVRAWNANAPDLWMECDFQSAGSDYQSWQASDNCIQKMTDTNGNPVELNHSNKGNGFEYRSSYNAINPSNFITNNSVFTKRNNGNTWTYIDNLVNHLHYDYFYGEWTTDYNKALIYAIRTP
jgi:hypothetical protein